MFFFFFFKKKKTKYEEVLVSVVAILGPMLSVPGKVPGFTDEGSNQHAKSEATTRGFIRAHRCRKIHFRHFWNSGHGGTQQIKRAREAKPAP